MLSDWMLRLRSLVRRDAVAQELDEELRFHMEQQVAAYMREGLGRHEAMRRARIEFGGLDQIKEEHRDARGLAPLEDLGRDARHAVRQLRRSPGFAAAAVLTLGLGIGATTAIYSVVNAILLRPLPFPDSDRLVRVVENVPHIVPGRPPLQRGPTYQQLLDWQARARTLSDTMTVSGGFQQLVRTSQGVAGLWGGTTSSNAFAVLGVRAMLGRTFDAGDDGSPVVVLTFDTWQRHFNSDPNVVGTTLEFRLGALLGPAPPRLMTVVGVLPAGFQFPDGQAEFYAPSRPPRSPQQSIGAVIGRLAPNVSLAAATEELNAIGAAIRPASPAGAPALTGPRIEIQYLKDLAVKDVKPALGLFLAAVVVVLLIVCANVANLLLARGTTRQREMAVRLAIGASRRRIVRQILTECLVLAVAGGALGALIGAAGVTLVKQLATVDAPGIFRLMFGSTILPRAQEVGVDLTVLGIAFSIASVTSVVFGLLPALHLSRGGQASALGSRGKTVGPAASQTRAALVVGQLVMATTLLVGAGLLIHSFIKLSTVNNGYDASNVLAVNLLFPNQYSPARKAETIDALLTRFRGVPNVQSAGFSRHGLLIGEEIMLGTFVPEGRTVEDMRHERTRVRSVSDGFLTAMGVPVLGGREFTTHDGATAPVIVMNRSAARQYFGSANPVGEVVNWEFDPGKSERMTIIGVVEDLRQTSPTDEVFPEVFIDFRQLMFLLERWKLPAQRQNEWAIGFLSFALRTSGDPAAVVPQVRQIVSAADPNVGIDAIVPMDRLVSSSVARQRFYAVLLGVFGGVAGLLAAIGIYGVMAYAVIQRAQEIGIRMALGAPRARVLALVLRKGLILTGIGIPLGLAGAAAVTRLLQGMLFGITPLDARTFLAVSMMFGLVTTLASYVPARRATRVDPMMILRNE